MRAVRIHTVGPPGALVVDDVTLPPLAPGEVRIKTAAAGVNFLDVYHRSGAYPLPSLPHGIGVEASGVVVDVGADITHLKPGDRVGYVWRQPGAYAEERNVPAQFVVGLPAELADDVAAASLVKGLTAEYLLRRTFRVDGRHTIVVHAAAGGVGTLLCQWGRALGARVIGIVSTEEKARATLQAGAHHALLAAHADGDGLAQRVRELAPDGVDVVYDSVGKDTFHASLDMLRPRGLLALFGQASGPVPPFAPALLAAKGSLFLTRPSLFDYISDAGELRSAADALFDGIKRGALRPAVTRRYALADARQAHEDLESRRTTGSIVLVP